MAGGRRSAFPDGTGWAAAAWISANELLTHAVARLRKVETTMSSQLDAVLDALRDVDGP